MVEVSKSEVDKLYKTLDADAESSGYHLNPDKAFTKDLVRNLLVNKKRYGYMACPCRLAMGIKQEDLDIICPCDYRDADLNEFGACYCALYVSEDIKKGKKKAKAIPERRPPKKERVEKHTLGGVPSELKKPVWRCKVCGYLCGRDNPPEVCPVCKAKKDRFERFM